MREAVYFAVIQKSDGHHYTIGKRKYEKNPDRWQIIDSHGVEKIAVPKDKESILQKIAEFTDTDLDLSVSVEDLPYSELRKKVVDLGIEVSGNPKREVLLKLYNEA